MSETYGVTGTPMAQADIRQGSEQERRGDVAAERMSI
jgi:hypothetical protein